MCIPLCRIFTQREDFRPSRFFLRAFLNLPFRKINLEKVEQKDKIIRKFCFQNFLHFISSLCSKNATLPLTLFYMRYPYGSTLWAFLPIVHLPFHCADNISAHIPQLRRGRRRMNPAFFCGWLHCQPIQSQPI